jgi:hypothetical protein
LSLVRRPAFVLPLTDFKNLDESIESPFTPASPPGKVGGMTTERNDDQSQDRNTGRVARGTQALLKREKEHTRLGDELARERRELPWVRVEKDYRFQTDDGEKSLAELFDGRSQLLVYHFMFGPSYQAGCPVNSSIADSIDVVVSHLHARDGTLGMEEGLTLAVGQIDAILAEDAVRPA